MTDSELVVIDPEYRLGIIPAKTPHDVIVQATKIAKELSKIVKDNRLANKIQGKEFVRVEGWSTMGAMLGVLPREVPELAKRFDDGSYEAVVELVRISDGAVIGKASALVGMDEKDSHGKLTWGNRNEYARKSMAITRATGKAYRLGFSWIMTLAGYEATPAEEIIDSTFKESPKRQTNPTPTNGDHKGKVIGKEDKPATPPATNGRKRPFKPDVVKIKFGEAVVSYIAAGHTASESDRNMIAPNMEMCFAGDKDSIANRKAVMQYLVGKTSVKDLSDAEIIAFKNWVHARPDDGGEWHPDTKTVQEAVQINILALKNEGQQELLKEDNQDEEQFDHNPGDQDE